VLRKREEGGAGEKKYQLGPTTHYKNAEAVRTKRWRGNQKPQQKKKPEAGQSVLVRIDLPGN